MQHTRTRKLSKQVKDHANRNTVREKQYEGNEEKVISTGSTTLDLAISGGRIKGGGLPAGIMVEIFGPASCGKTVVLCELAANVHSQGGEVMFRDPEARLNKEFAHLFGLNVENIEYSMPATIPEVFKPIREWTPKHADRIHGAFADSLTALTTAWELEEKDQYGMRRAKEFSEELRKTCRIIKQKNFLVVCSNQIRQNIDAGPYGQKWKSPGGEAIGFYSSLRLRCMSPQKIKKTRKISGKEVKRVVGVETEIEVYKSSVWKPYHTATVYIIFDYGIDDIRSNLKFIKDNIGEFRIEDMPLPKTIDAACEAVEKEGVEQQLKEYVISLWEEIEAQFSSDRKPKHRREN